MRVALYSSKKPRCGIATYSEYLEYELRRLGTDVRHWGSLVNDDAVFSEIRSWSPDVFHVQYERSIMPARGVLGSFTRDCAARGRKNVVTFHSESTESTELLSFKCFHGVIVHWIPQFVGAKIIRMPCPVYAPSDKGKLRGRYGFATDAFVVSTVGFLLPWKKTEEIVRLLVPWLKKRPKAVLQVIASMHFSQDSRSYSDVCSATLRKLSASVDGRIKHISGYPSDVEVLDRLALSDLGYVYCPFDTASASAAASLFVSARCPLVTSTSTHYDHLIPYTVQAPKENTETFAGTIVKSAEDAALLLRLRSAYERLYAETNYNEAARTHLNIYESL